MIFFKRTTRSFLSLLMIGTIIFTTSCSKNDTPPELPSQASFVMDFDNFESGTTISDKTTDTTSANYFFSGVNVLVWNVILTLNMAIPVAAFGEAFNHEGVWDGKSKSYVWSYDYTIGLKTYTAELHGEKEDESNVSWEMYISQSGSFQNVLWYSGVTSIDGSSAKWVISKDGNNPIEYLQIEYAKSTDSNSSIKYTVIESGSDENGGYIVFGKTNEASFNVYYDIYIKSKDNLIEMEWNSSSRDGRVKNLVRFNDSDWHCWNAELKDEVCE